jgi:Glycosyl transferase family 2
VKLVLTVLARDEADVVDAQIAFHLNAGVDFVVATDNRSQDGTTEILESYARDGCLRLIHEPSEGLNQGAWVTRMARLAATEHGADWVINSDADEFWWPRGASLRDLLLAVPKEFGIVRAFWRSFVPRPDDGSFFAERMTARVSSRAPINDPTSFYRPVTKVAHRADPDVIVGRGNHALVGSRMAPLPTWHPIEVLHFPLRSRGQWRRKVELQGVAFTEYIERVGAGYHLKSYEALRTGRIDEQYESMVVDDGALARGVAGGTLVLDTRLRDVLGELRRAPEERSPRCFALPSERPAALVFPEPTIADDTEYAVQAAVLGEADVVRAQRRLDALEQRLRPHEARPPQSVITSP